MSTIISLCTQLLKYFGKSGHVLLFILICIRIYLMITIKNCKSKRSMVGKVVIVTGANSGIGFETAIELAKRGARVILACRDEKKAIAARDRIISETCNTCIVYKYLNLSSLASVRSFAKDIINSEEYLHVLINNAGICGFNDRYTQDEILEDMQINYFGPFLLTLLLLPLLKKSKPSRIINVSSMLHYFGEINLDNINVKGYYNSVQSYNNAKLCVLSSTLELSRRLAGSGVVANAVHPGVIITNIASYSNLFIKISFLVGWFFLGRTVSQGAQTTVHLAVSKECENVSGKYFVDCSERYMSWRAKKDISQQLWDFSKNLVQHKAQ